MYIYIFQIILINTYSISVKCSMLLQSNIQPKIVDAELRMHETVVLKILHLIYIKLNIALQ